MPARRAVSSRRPLVIAGPTGVGKSRLAVKVAGLLGAEIVSADSRQLYWGLDVGTATPTEAERGGVRHHLIDVLDPTERVTAGWFEAQARRAIEDIHERGKPVVVVGGSTLYVHALLEGLAPLPSLESDLEAHLGQIAATAGGRAALFEELQAADPVAAATLDPTKSQRLVRLVGVLRQSGRPVSEAWGDTSPGLDCRLVVLERPRAELYQRIDARVLDMVERGLVDEVRSVLDRWPGSLEVLQSTIGYRELLPVLDGSQDLETAIALIQRNSRRYAKRQLTWYRRYPEAVWLDADSAIAEGLAELIADATA